MTERQHEYCRHFSLGILAYEIGTCGACGTEPAPISATGFVPGEEPGTVFGDADASECPRFEPKGGEVVSITRARDAELDQKIMARAAHLLPEGRR